MTRLLQAAKHIFVGMRSTERTHTNVTRNASNITATSLTKKTDAQPMLVGSISLVVTSQVLLLLLAIFGQVIILDISWYFVVGLMYTSNVSQHCSKFISIWRLPTLLFASSVLLLKPQPSFLSCVFFSTPVQIESKLFVAKFTFVTFFLGRDA